MFGQIVHLGSGNSGKGLCIAIRAAYAATVSEFESQFNRICGDLASMTLELLGRVRFD